MIFSKQNLNLLIIFPICLSLMAAPLFFSAWPERSLAQEEEEECKGAEVHIVARDSYGDFIPNITVEISEQEIDADMLPKPGKKIGSSKIDPILGYANFSFKPSGGNYAIKMYSINKDFVSYYFYNDLSPVCGEVETVTESLSAIKVILRDTEDILIKNKKFSLYTQRYDEDDEPIKEKKDFVIELDTTAIGAATAYVPSGANAIDGNGGDHYVIEIKGDDGGVFREFDIRVNDGSTTEVDYVLSDMKLEIEDANGVPFPANTKVEIYEQDYDADDVWILGEHVKDIYTDDKGTAIFTYPAGEYVARILGKDNQYQYFWDLEVDDRDREEYTLTSDSEWLPDAGACESDSTFTLVTRNLAGDYISGLNFELHEKTADVDGEPQTGFKALSGTVSGDGQAVSVFNPDPRKQYVLKIYDKNPDVGEFWFYDDLQFACGDNRKVEKYLPVFKIILRDGNKELLKNHSFSLYTQKHDVDGNPIHEKKDLVSADFKTTEEGAVITYLAPDHPYNKNKKGTYVFTSQGQGKALHTEYDIKIQPSSDQVFEYIFSNIVFTLEDASNRVIPGANISLYEQLRKAGGGYEAGKSLNTANTDSNGEAQIEYPAGYYAVVIKDDLGMDNIFFNTRIKNRESTFKTISTNLTRVYPKNSENIGLGEKTSVNIYSMVKSGEGKYIKDKKIKTIKVLSTGYAEASLAPAPYLFTVSQGKTEYGTALYSANGQLQEIVIRMNSTYELVAGREYSLSAPAGNSLAERLSGHILLQVEENGEAWYVDPKSKKRFYMKNGEAAYYILREFGLGITNENLRKLPVGLDDRFEEFDYDGDFVPDKMEEALGTDMYWHDTDDDGFDDNVELENGFDPNGEGLLPIDKNLAEKLRGNILLQVESRGEAWYVNPKDSKRYYMKDGDSAYEIMRYLSLGITNENLEEIETGVIALSDDEL